MALLQVEAIASKNVEAERQWVCFFLGTFPQNPTVFVKKKHERADLLTSCIYPRPPSIYVYFGYFDGIHFGGLASSVSHFEVVDTGKFEKDERSVWVSVVTEQCYVCDRT